MHSMSVLVWAFFFPSSSSIVRSFALSHSFALPFIGSVAVAATLLWYFIRQSSSKKLFCFRWIYVADQANELALFTYTRAAALIHTQQLDCTMIVKCLKSTSILSSFSMSSKLFRVRWHTMTTTATINTHTHNEKALKIWRCVRKLSIWFGLQTLLLVLISLLKQICGQTAGWFIR